MATFHLSIKSGKKGKAAEHAAYIAREGKHKKDQHDLTANEYGNLPIWANDNPSALWRAADKFERSNGAAYRELEIALPVELTLDQNRALVQELINKTVGAKPYQFAIHEPNSALGDVKQPHVHLMISDRKPDGFERNPEQHFKRFNTKNPAAGGCRKDSGGKEPVVLREEVRTLRKTCADIQNEFLEKYGHSSRVDHRSNRERGISTLPERHIGSAVINAMTKEEKKSFQRNRQDKKLLPKASTKDQQVPLKPPTKELTCKPTTQSK